MIPKRLHYCWYGPEKTERAKNCIESWQRLLPAYEFIEWNESNTVLDTPFLKYAFEQKKWNRLSNYVRARALFDQGGIYLDTDIELIKSTDDLLGNHCFLGFQLRHLSDECVNVAFIGSIPGHPFWQACMQRWDKMYHDQGILELAPFTVTFLLKERGLRHCVEQMLGDIKLYPVEYFYPYSWHETFVPQKHIKPQTYGIHYWASSHHSSSLGRLTYHVEKLISRLKGK
jgi:hypothetical protein